MISVRSIVPSRLPSARLLLAVAVSLAVIGGLMGMHTLNSPRQGHGSTQSAVVTVPHGTVEVPMSGQPADADVQPCECTAPVPVPEHSMLVMACILAILLALLLLAPRSVAVRLGTLLVVGTGVMQARGALARRRPPSLLILSISRT